MTFPSRKGSPGLPDLILPAAAPSARPAEAMGSPADPRLALALVELAPYPIYVKDAHGRYLFVNRSFNEICNPDGAAIAGRTSAEVYGEVLAAAYAEHDAEVLAAGGPVAREFTYSRGARTNIYSSIKFPMHDAAGAPVAIGGIDVDITPQVRREMALRESEARFREMADSVPALIWTSDCDGQCTFVNKRWAEFTGRRVEQEMGRGFAESIHPEDRPHSVDREPEHFATREASSVEYRLRRADGEYRWFLDSFVPRYDTDASFIGFIGTLVDVTDRRQLEETLSRTLRLEALGRLTGGVAHDFNNLLTVILGNCEMLAEIVDPESPLQALAQRAIMASSRASELTGRLLAFSRHQALESKATDLSQLIDQTHELLERTLGEEIAIETKVLSGLWPAVVDTAELEHALLNLAINARDAMPRGGTLTMTAGNVTLDRSAVAAAHLQCRPGDYVAISVVDSGVGMSPEVLRRAIEPFYTTKEVGRGSGLGLSMVYGFCKQSGGDLRLDSVPGRGTTVTLFLPRADAGRTADSADARDRLRDLPGGSETVLVVEDNEEVRAYVVGCLSALGYGVLSAADGVTALRMLETHPDIDLLFTDVVMPGGMSGWELAVAGRSHRPGLKVLVTTGYAPGRLGRPAGSERLPLLPKPYPRHALAAKVREVLDSDPTAGPEAAAA
jgi:PAS domain S-box-containing protein